MSAQTPDAQVDPVKTVPRPAEDIEAQVRAEYAKFLEKRDAIRKSTGKFQRTSLRTLLS